MMKVFKYMVLFLALLIVVILVQYLARRALPVESPVFWISAALEVAMAYLVYSFWIRSMAGQAFRNYRFWSMVIFLVALAWPILIDYVFNSKLLQPAGSTDLFFIAGILSLTSFYLFKDNYVSFFELFRRK